MTAADLQLARSLLEAFNAGDEAAAAALFDPEGHEIVPIRAAIEDTVYRGPDAYARFIADSRETWSRQFVDLHELRDCGDGRVLGLGRMDATSRGGGLEVALECGFVIEIRGGRVVFLRTYTDPEEAVRACDRPVSPG